MSGDKDNALDLDPDRMTRLRAYAESKGLSVAEALASAVDRMLSFEASEDHLTEDDFPEDLI